MIKKYTDKKYNIYTETYKRRPIAMASHKKHTKTQAQTHTDQETRLQLGQK
jgi:hypothetical protein